MACIQIVNKKIGRDCPPFVIAEAGINHNGNLDIAFEMIRVAKRSGADAIKFQTFKAEEFISDPAQTYTYKSQGIEITESMLEMFKRYEFSHDQWRSIKSKCDQEEIMFLSTPQNVSDLTLLLEIEIPMIKVGSDDFTNIPLLKNYAKTGLPLLLSCGMADFAEVFNGLEAVGAFDGYPVILLLCTSQYPTPPDDVNLRKLTSLIGAFPMISVGFSDHTQGPLASVMALALGASVFEKHFTLDHNMSGPDHWFSADPDELTTWVDFLRDGYLMLGDGIVRPTPTERSNKKEFQRVIVARQEIKNGDIYTEDNLTLLRVKGGKGMSPAILKLLLGQKAHKSYRSGEAIEL
ncbi:MAG: N-acetylneuraminate synthase family protein [Negativicutes bacterium]|nr:N-acetylneuraminate synthase family protein [Negativicutes bacterium]